MNNIFFRVLCACLFMLGVCSSFGQHEYIPLNSDKGLEHELLTDLKKRYEIDLASIDGKLKKKKKEAYKQRFRELSRKIENGHFVFDKDFVEYFQNIFNSIIEANAVLQKQDLRLLISKYAWPNASCYGEGTIVLNLGLISRLKNESQVAFVLCHELAHDIENHVNKSINKNIERLYGKETRKKLKKISKSGGETHIKATQLLEAISFDMRRHSRLYEAEADSIALRLMSNTKYDTREAVSCLRLLDEADLPKRPYFIDFKKWFNSTNFQIEDRWLEQEESTGLIYAKLSKEKSDSLKTHPDCKKRIRIAEAFKHFEQENWDKSDFKKYSRTADFEIIEGEYFNANYGLALFHTFLLIEDYPDDAYLHAMVIHCLLKLYEHQLSHELGKILDLPDSKFDDNYNHFLSFFHSLRLKELRKLGYFYGVKNGASFMKNEKFRVAHLKAAIIETSPGEWKKMRQEYYSDFPKGKYKKEIRELLDLLKNKDSD